MTKDGSAARSHLHLQSLDAQPFLKWAGGKRSLIPHIEEYLPKKFNSYVEPFLGGGALFFHLKPQEAFLNDVNAELINTYRVVRDYPDRLIAALKKHVYQKEHFYRVRDLQPTDLPLVEQAARMIYLNRVGFNGLYRVNSKGGFNVPFGRHTIPKSRD